MRAENNTPQINTSQTNAPQTNSGQTPTRVVITGMGAITCLGLDVAITWEKLLAGESGIRPITRFDPSELRTHFAGEVQDFDASNYMDRKEVRRLDPVIQFTLAAAKEAVADAGIDFSHDDPARTGVIIGTAIGGLHATWENAKTLFERGMRKVSPFMITNMLVDSASGRLAIEYGLNGPNHSVVSACASGTSACGEAFEMLRRGDADVVVAGGAEAAIVPLTFAGFDVMGALSQRNHDPAGACRPFETERDGFVISEGAAVLIMETEAHAKARGAHIYAEVIGYGSSADASSMVAPHEQGLGAIIAMNMALRKAGEYGVAPTDVDYVNAHGTGTKLNDFTETLAIKKVFGEHAYAMPLSSTKSMLGHLLGAAGAIETLVCAKVIQEGMIPPTINLDNPDPECDLDYTPFTAKAAQVDVTLSNSFGFGGHNACIMLRRYV